MIDPLIHAPARLTIMAVLSRLPVGESILFPVLQRLTELTSGNLTTHLRQLEAAGYVRITSTGRGRGSATSIGLRPGGRRALAAYRRELTALLGPAPDRSRR